MKKIRKIFRQVHVTIPPQLSLFLSKAKKSLWVKNLKLSKLTKAQDPAM